MGGERLAIPAGGRRELLPLRQDLPGRVQDPLAIEALVPGRVGDADASGVARVGLVQAAEVAGGLAQAHPAGDDLGRQGALGLVAAAARLPVGLQVLAVLDRPGEGRQVAVAPGAPAAEGEADPGGGGEGGRGEQGEAKAHGRSPGAKARNGNGTKRRRPVRRATS
jgi:hypothetical protein